MAAALLAYEARVTTSQRSGLTIGDLLGDGSNGAADNALQPGEMIGSIELPAPVAVERAIYKRAISRTHAEWPLVEVCARAVVKDGVFEFIRVTAGGIAPVPRGSRPWKQRYRARERMWPRLPLPQNKQSRVQSRYR